MLMSSRSDQGPGARRRNPKSVEASPTARPRECEVSGHSLRVGAAQDLLIRGHDISAIMRAGGWDSVRVVSNYLRLAEHNIWE